ncbi:MAG: hypothetical protein HY204_10295 [Nitrospirae bacterium]|nr:hypothetical protein [Nitrospirota bacterium]
MMSSFFSWEWFEALPWEYQWALGGILPALILAVWLLNFFRKQSDSVWVLILLRTGMLAIVILSAYLCYFILIRIQVGRLMETTPAGTNVLTAPKQLEDQLKKQEEERLKRLEEVAEPK